MKKIQIVLACIALLFAVIPFGRAQTNNTVVSLEAEAAGLSLLPSDDVPATGTFWTVTTNSDSIVPPFPGSPLNASLPVYQISIGQFLVDGTEGDIGLDATALTEQADAVSNLITKVEAETTTASQTSRTMGIHALDDSGPPSFSDTNDDGGDYTYTNLLSLPPINTNLLWIQITNVANGLAYLNLNMATDTVYAIWGTTNLLTPFTNWQVFIEVWPTNGTTNLLSFTVNTYDNTNLFWRAEDWTGVYLNGLPEWWTWLNFGNLSEAASDLDSLGVNTLGYDFTNHLDPNIIDFTVGSTNQYADASDAPVQIDLAAGTPSYIAVLVDDSNPADASWTAYTSTNITANLGTTQGWHQVYVGLRGFSANAYQTWESTSLKLNLTPPLLVITNPTASVVTQPLIQLQGYSPEALASLTYDLTNAAGLVRNRQVLILGQYYDINTMELTTNYFQCFDVPLTNGVNTITLHATDMAGNVTTTNFSYNLDYSSATNPPVVQLFWPQAGTQISGNSFTWRGQVNEPTAQVVAQTVDDNGNTNSVTGQVGRDGCFWISGLPLSSGTNNLSMTVTDAAGNITTTNISVLQSTLVLTITSAGLGQAVTGTISDTNLNDYTIWVNGTKATNNGDGTWIAQPNLTLDTPNVQVRAIPNSDNGGNGGGQ